MPKVFQPDPVFVRQLQYSVIVARDQEKIADRLLEGAIRTFAEQGVPDEKVDVYLIPRAAELPVAARLMAYRARYSVIVCLGAIVREGAGEVEHLVRQVSRGLSGLAPSWTTTPIVNGLLVCPTFDEAIARSGGSKGNYGAECAASALALVSLTQITLPSFGVIGEQIRRAFGFGGDQVADAKPAVDANPAK